MMKNIIKRNGSVQLYNQDKIAKRIKSLSYDLDIDVDALLSRISDLIKDQMTTRDLDRLVSEESYARLRYSLDYDKLSSRISWNDLHKSTETRFLDKLNILKERLDPNYYEFAKKNIDVIEKTIDYRLDYNIGYFGFRTLAKSYLLKVNNKIVERYQDLLMRVALYINMNNIRKAIKSYHVFSNNLYTHATTTLFNAGIVKSTLSSCFLLDCSDSLTANGNEGICDKWHECSLISARCGGICINMTPVREEGREIKGSGGRTGGIVPFIRTFERISECINQGGKRNGSTATSLELWHPEIIPFLSLRTNTGDEQRKAPNIFTALMIPDIFFKRLETLNENTLWSLFSPLDHPELLDLYSDEFEKRYLELEKERRYVSQFPLFMIWIKVLKALVETGTPFMLSKCNINKVSNHMNIGTIRNSNLCNEIMQYHNYGETAVCNLCSIALPKFLENEIFNFKKLKKVIKLVVHNMNRVIDVDQIPIPNNSLKQRAIGIGVQGLMDVFQCLGWTIDSQETKDLNLKIFEYMYYYALYYSCKLAKKFGPYEYFEGSPLSQGKFQFEYFDNIKVTLDWDRLRSKIKLYGVRNSLMIALMPTASTAQIFGNTESFELPASNIYTRKVQSGDFTVINKYMYRDLKKLDLWNKKIVDDIIFNDGSLQKVKEIPDYIKRRYLTCWEIKQKVLLDLAADRTPFIDQSQSFNFYYSNPTCSKLTSYYIHAWKRGMKTLSYYLRTKPAKEATKSTIEAIPIKQETKKTIVCTDEVCVSCSS